MLLLQMEVATQSTLVAQESVVVRISGVPLSMSSGRLQIPIVGPRSCTWVLWLLLLSFVFCWP